MDEPSLTARQRELMQGFLSAADSSGQPFFDFGHGPFQHPGWPPEVKPPTREEVRALLAAGMLDNVRRVQQGAWRVLPSAEARRLFGGADAEATDAALRDPHRRLGLILEATVAAFEAAPDEPLHFAPSDQVDIVQHPHWRQLPSNVVHEHDLRQLEDLGLVATTSRGQDLAFWPTPAGRAAIHDPPAYLDRIAEQTRNEREQSRLREWARRLRASDVTVGTVANVSGGLIRALVGL